MTFLELVALCVGLIVSFITICGAVIAGGAWIMKNNHERRVVPVFSEMKNALERTIDATEANTTALLEQRSENRDAFDGIHEIVSEVRQEQRAHGEKLSEHGARLDGHDIELRDVKQATAMRATKARRVVE